MKNHISHQEEIDGLQASSLELPKEIIIDKIDNILSSDNNSKKILSKEERDELIDYLVDIRTKINRTDDLGELNTMLEELRIIFNKYKELCKTEKEILGYFRTTLARLGQIKSDIKNQKNNK
ncbi:MAG: hypothetical protein PHN31_01335 [Candidatus Gracilibacteria bacterium]|nr:hypothetical protein [Candidatus Gracilibacteria bacterium]